MPVWPPVPGGLVYLKFTTRDTTGLPTVLTGSPVISIYKDDSTTQSTAGVSLTASFDSVVGLNHISVDTSADGTFYSVGSTFYAVITTGTVAGVSVVGETVGSFYLVPAALTAASIATGVWQDTTSGDFTMASSIGKSLYTAGVAPGASGGILISGSNSGTTTLAALTVTGATLHTGGFTVGGITIPNLVWNEVNTGATHNVTSSTGKQLRSIALSTTAIYVSTPLPSQSGVTSVQVKLDSGASAVNGAYVGNVMSVTAGTGSGSAICTAYVGSTRLATVDRAWVVQPIAGDTVEITPTAQIQVASYLVGQDPATLVLDVQQSLHNTAGTVGFDIGRNIGGLGF